MELQFAKNPCFWLEERAGDTRNLEQTLEVKLPDAMPDIGKVLCGWGQALVRSKQWNRDNVGLSGGVMAWVLYQPEDGSQVRSVECWIPFQARWDIPEREHDGVLLAQCYLQGVDARSLSARKLMVRCTVGLSAQAMVSVQQEIAQPGELPPDIQVQKKEHDLMLTVEAGEKMVSLEEDIPSPAGPVPEKLMYYWLHPQITDCKLMADRAVFRGTALGHCLYRGEDGNFHSWDFSLPFSQYSELDREYGPEALLRLTLVPTGLEMELGEEGRLHVKANLIGQYTVYDRKKLELVTDAYSTDRDTLLTTQELTVPIVEEFLEDGWEPDGAGENTLSEVMDTAFFLDAPRGDGDTIPLSGRWQVMGMDSEGAMACESIPWQGQWQAGGDSRVCLWQTQKPQADGSGVRAWLAGQGVSITKAVIPMVTGLALKEPRQRAQERPSLILGRASGSSLWDMAKKNATTAQRIMDANGLTQEPEAGRWMIIPVP